MQIIANASKRCQRQQCPRFEYAFQETRWNARKNCRVSFDILIILITLACDILLVFTIFVRFFSEIQIGRQICDRTKILWLCWKKRISVWPKFILPLMFSISSIRKVKLVLKRLNLSIDMRIKYFCKNFWIISMRRSWWWRRVCARLHMCIGNTSNHGWLIRTIWNASIGYGLKLDMTRLVMYDKNASFSNFRRRFYHQAKVSYEFPMRLLLRLQRSEKEMKVSQVIQRDQKLMTNRQAPKKFKQTLWQLTTV